MIHARSSLTWVWNGICSTWWWIGDRLRGRWGYFSRVNKDPIFWLPPSLLFSPANIFPLFVPTGACLNDNCEIKRSSKNRPKDTLNFMLSKKQKQLAMKLPIFYIHRYEKQHCEECPKLQNIWPCCEVQEEDDKETELGRASASTKYSRAGRGRAVSNRPIRLAPRVLLHFSVSRSPPTPVNPSSPPAGDLRIRKRVNTQSSDLVDFWRVALRPVRVCPFSRSVFAPAFLAGSNTGLLS
jgi:hypothetical protein